MEIYVNVVSVTKEDSRIHNYQIPDSDCFAHLEVQFKFYDLSSKVEGVLGRTYQPDFENPAKLGVAMPVVGGEDRYRTSSILSADCGACLFASGEDSEKKNNVFEYGMMDCRSVANSGNGIVWKDKCLTDVVSVIRSCFLCCCIKTSVSAHGFTLNKNFYVLFVGNAKI